MLPPQEGTCGPQCKSCMCSDIACEIHGLLSKACACNVTFHGNCHTVLPDSHDLARPSRTMAYQPYHNAWATHEYTGVQIGWLGALPAHCSHGRIPKEAGDSVGCIVLHSVHTLPKELRSRPTNAPGMCQTGRHCWSSLKLLSTSLCWHT